jgi:hypothetical protein
MFFNGKKDFLRKGARDKEREVMGKSGRLYSKNDRERTRERERERDRQADRRERETVEKGEREIRQSDRVKKVAIRQS